MTSRKFFFGVLLLSFVCELLLPAVMQSQKAFARRAYSSYGDVEAIQVYTPSSRPNKGRKRTPARRQVTANPAPIAKKKEQPLIAPIEIKPKTSSSIHGATGLSARPELTPPTSLDALKKQYESAEAQK